MKTKFLKVREKVYSSENTIRINAVVIGGISNNS